VIRDSPSDGSQAKLNQICLHFNDQVRWFRDLDDDPWQAVVDAVLYDCSVHSVHSMTLWYHADHASGWVTHIVVDDRSFPVDLRDETKHMCFVTIGVRLLPLKGVFVPSPLNLSAAVKAGNRDAVVRMVRQGADAGGQVGGQPHLWEAVKRLVSWNDSGALDALLDAPGNHVYQTDKYGNNMLLFAVMNHASIHLLDRLLRMRFSVHDTNAYGNTALHICMAIPVYVESTAPLLVGFGGLAVLARNNDGKLPRDVGAAHLAAQSGIMMTLQEHEARARLALEHLVQEYVLVPLAEMVVAYL
jgi:hypothetical protein